MNFSTSAGSLYFRSALFSAVLVIGCVVFWTPLDAQSSFQVWVAPSLERIAQNQQAGSNAEAKLYAARGEYESFQIVVRAGGASVNNVNVSVSDLVGPGGQIIPSSNATLFREHYVYVNEASPDGGGPNRPLGPGWYTDALIPFRDPTTGADLTGPIDAVPFSVQPGFNQPVWVDLFIPRSAVTGQYTGSFTVTSNQGTFTGAISLKVWNFTLPSTPTLKTSFHAWQRNDLDTTRELLRNRVSPRHVAPALQRGLIDSYGLTVRDLGYWSGAHYQHCIMSVPPPFDQLRASAVQHQTDLAIFNYTADEIDQCPTIFPTLRLWARNLHLAGVRNLVAMTPTRQLYDDGLGTGRSVVDIWVVLPTMYERAGSAIGEVQAKGDEVWSYNTLVQDGHSPKWTIDYAPINHRIQGGFINQSLNLRGLLYWRVDLFDVDPWINVNNRDVFGQYNVSGEGFLLYPGSRVGLAGSVPSMRLKWIRDSVEDFELIELLRKAGRTSSAMQIVRRVGADWRNWTRDPNVLEAARIQLGNELHRNSTEAPSIPGGGIPVSDAAGVSPSTLLSWTPSSGDPEYDVYLGTVPNPAVIATIRAASYKPAVLSYGTTYYWKVVAKNDLGQSESPVWSFTTKPLDLPAARVAIHPPEREGFGGQLLKFTFPISGPNTTGATVLINRGPVFLNACWLYYDRAGNRLSLSSDDTANWSFAGLGSQNTLWNSQCVVNAAESNASVSDGELTLTVWVTFLLGFEGDRTVFLRTTAAGSAGGESPLHAAETKTVTAGSMR